MGQQCEVLLWGSAMGLSLLQWGQRPQFVPSLSPVCAPPPSPPGMGPARGQRGDDDAGLSPKITGTGTFWGHLWGLGHFGDVLGTGTAGGTFWGHYGDFWDITGLGTLWGRFGDRDSLGT